jgi:hypothetical protein
MNTPLTTVLLEGFFPQPVQWLENSGERPWLDDGDDDDETPQPVATTLMQVDLDEVYPGYPDADLVSVMGLSLMDDGMSVSVEMSTRALAFLSEEEGDSIVDIAKKAFAHAIDGGAFQPDYLSRPVHRTVRPKGP